MRAVLTRTGDYFVKFEDRIGRARDATGGPVRLDPRRRVHGPQRARLLGLCAVDAPREQRGGAQLAERENAADLIGGVSLHDKSDVLASVLLDLSQNAAISASRDAAARVLARARHGRPAQEERRAAREPDRAELARHSLDAGRDGIHLEPRRRAAAARSAHQDRLADAIHAGIRRYFYENPPPGTRVAMLAARERGQALRHVVSPGETLVDVAAATRSASTTCGSSNRLDDRDGRCRHDPRDPRRRHLSAGAPLLDLRGDCHAAPRHADPSPRQTRSSTRSPRARSSSARRPSSRNWSRTRSTPARATSTIDVEHGGIRLIRVRDDGARHPARRNCRSRSRATRPARSPRSTTSSASRRSAFAARRCRRSPRCRACASRRARDGAGRGLRSSRPTARSAGRRRRRIRRARRSRCATCFTACRRGASSCAPKRPSSSTC